jgi:hypothetical protein
MIGTMKNPIYVKLTNNDIAYTNKLEDITDPHEVYETLSFCPELDGKNPSDFIVYVDFDIHKQVVGIEVV